jgi:hypothetical protein
MKTYLALTAFVFGALTLAHVWRAAVEPNAWNLWFLVSTVISATLCVWAIWLWRRAGSSNSNST